MARLARRALRSLRALARAHLSARAARITWADADGAFSAHTCDVLALAFERPRWLVAARPHEAAGVRVLPLDRVRSVDLSPEAAAPAPEDFDPIDFSIRRYLQMGAAPPRRTAVRLPRPLAAFADALLPTATRTPTAGGTVCHVRATRPDVLAALAVSLGAPAAVHSRAMSARSQKPLPTDARLIGLASWILSQPESVTRSQIYEAFPDDYRGSDAAREKKFTRDKDALKRLGFHLETESIGNGDGQVAYFLDPCSYTLPALTLEPQESAVIWAAGASAVRFSQHPLREDLESALRKLLVGAKGLPPATASQDDLAPVPEGKPSDRHLEKLAEAWERRKTIAISYWRVATDEVVEREVDVYGWASRRGEWLFVGYCHLRDEVRVFYLSRVRALKVNTKSPSKPDYVIPDDFDIRRWSRQQIWDYDVHPPEAATIRFKGSLAHLAKQLLPDAKVQTDAEGARVGRLEVRNLRGLVRQALAWGPEAELVEPPEGRAMAREILAELAGGAQWGTP